MMKLMNRLLTYAPVESFFCLATLIAGSICLAGFYQFDASPLAVHVTPVIYIFGAWPFYALLLVGGLLGFFAYEKSLRG